MRSFRYEAAGQDGAGQQWSCSGSFSASDFLSALQAAQRLSFVALTNGLATYGSPGAGGCQGPYKFQKLLVEERPEGQ